MLVAGVVSSRGSSAPPVAAPASGDDDVSLHRAIVARLAQGEGYYEATGVELRARGYPTRSVFNWRTPLLFTVVSRAPAVARAVLIGLGVLLLVATILEFSPQPPYVVIAAAVAQAGAIPITAVPGAIYLHEVWAGALIAVSVWLYLRKRWLAAAFVGLLALFVRELAAPFCVVAGLLAIQGRRWREAGVWAIGACIYGAFYWLHVGHVYAHLRPGDLAHGDSWVQWGGLHFILSTLRWNGWLTVAPPSGAAVALTVLVAGLIDGRVDLHLRLACVAYLGLFAVAGHEFNNYWGAIPLMVYPMLFAFGIAGVGPSLPPRHERRRHVDGKVTT